MSFFEEHTFIPSGAYSQTRRMAQSKTDMYALFVSTYPQILRQLHQENPSLVPKAYDIAQYPGKTFENLTVLQRSILAAVRAKEKDNFDVDQEKTNLHLKFMAKYNERLQAKNSSRKTPGMRPQATKIKATPTSTPEFWAAVQTDGVSPISSAFFWGILKCRNIGLTKIHAHPCPLHQKGPNHVACLEAVRSQLAALPEEVEKLDDALAPSKLDLTSQLENLQKKVREWELHLEQFKRQRQYIQEIEENLQDRECIVFRNFVNQHNVEGAKVINLVLTVVWRERGKKQVLKLHHFCTDKTKGTDAGFFKDVMDFQLSPKDDHHNGIFDNFDKIYLSGDHGPHFACNETVLWESRVKEVYGKIVEPIFLCSYHAYNRCDGAGMETKR